MSTFSLSLLMRRWENECFFAIILRSSIWSNVSLIDYFVNVAPLSRVNYSSPLILPISVCACPFVVVFFSWIFYFSYKRLVIFHVACLCKKALFATQKFPLLMCIIRNVVCVQKALFIAYPSCDHTARGTKNIALIYLFTFNITYSGLPACVRL